MTGDPLLDLLISLLGVLLLVGICVALGGGRRVALDEAVVQAALNEEGMQARASLLSPDAALLLGDREALVLVVMGAHIARRRVPLPLRAKARGDTLTVQFGDLAFPPLQMSSPRAAAWAEMLQTAEST